VADLAQVGDSQDEANGVKDVGFATAVETSNGVEFRVPQIDAGAGGVGLEALHDDLLDVHLWWREGGRIWEKRKVTVRIIFFLLLSSSSSLFKRCEGKKKYQEC